MKEPHPLLCRQSTWVLTLIPTGTVAGGLAGILYGLDDVPDYWQNSLARKPEIDHLVSYFTSVIIGDPLNSPGNMSILL